MPFTSGKLCAGIPETLREEFFETLAGNSGVRIERIISAGHTTPPGKWYDQAEQEWVLLVSGSATLRFEETAELLHLTPGDHVTIPARCRHRVEQTAADQKTVWLAVHYHAE